MEGMRRLFYKLLLSESKLVRFFGSILFNALVVGTTIGIILGWAVLVSFITESWWHLGAQGYLGLWISGILVAFVLVWAAFKG